MKKTLRTVGQSLIIFWIAVGVYSCQQEEFADVKQDQINENFVSMDEAMSFASILEYQTISASGRTTSTTKEIESVLEVPDQDGNPSFYIVNYQDSGYIILSADDRVEPIRAFSTEDNFSFDFESYPNGLVEWLAGNSGLIHEARVLNLEQTDAIAQTWEICQMQQVMTLRPIDDDGCGGSGGGGGGCQDQYWEYGPLLTTVWGQWGGYNDLAPDLSCNNADGRAPTGCVATAMAQIMNYHEFPISYNYSDMPDTWGTLSTARLMRDAGDAVNMDWGCDGSGADTKDEVASSFRNDFGYASASYADFNQETVKQQIRWNRPVILRGGRKGKWFIFPVYKDGHAWVCDGYKRWTYCETGTGYLYLHMNWGWSSQALNGWFAYNNWSVNGNDFNYKKGMVYNIKPQ
ncbi:MAG: hypothetical protein GY816_03645 [Cytophagales bacterium]|nr:hypothetical protein [Cytophagales bacterium]